MAFCSYFCRLPDVRAHIVSEVAKEATNNIGMGMTFTLFEWVKEKAEELSVSQPETISDSINKVTISEPQVHNNVIIINSEALLFSVFDVYEYFLNTKQIRVNSIL